jgi:hypothetical protein
MAARLNQLGSREQRLRRQAIAERVSREVAEKWPHITPENAAEVLEWQRMRMAELEGAP